MTRTSALALTLLTASVTASAAEKAPPPPKPIPYGPGRQLCELGNVEIEESSGLACSRRNRGVFWTHNDSGDGPRLYAFNRKGDHLGVFAIHGARARDWEDMASFARGRKSYLLVGDVGDNPGARSKCTLYIVPEPRLARGKRGVEGKLRGAQAVHFTYPGGPRNCEAVAVDPTTLTAYVVSKEVSLQCKAYALPLRRNPSGKPWVAKAIATLKVPVVTAMDISPDGRRAIVLTYMHACEYTRRPDESWAQAFARAPRVVAMPPRQQGESICYGPDGKTLYLTSEKTPTPLLEVPVARPQATSPPRREGEAPAETHPQ